MRRVVTLIIAAAHIVGLLHLTACKNERAPSDTSPTPAFRMAVWQAPVLAGASPFSPERFTGAVLINMDRSGRPLPGVVRTWQTADRQTWTLTLRENLRLHSGERLTSREVLNRLEQMAPRWPENPVWRDIERVDTPTPTTLVFRLRRPASFLIESLIDLALGVETGPYRLLNRTPTRMDFQASDDFWDDRPIPPRVRVDLYPSERAAWAAFLRNEADYLRSIPPTSADLLSDHPDVRLCPPLYRQAFMLGFRLQHPLLKDVRVRRAINLAIDREKIVREVFAGYSIPVAGPFSPHYWAVAQSGEHWPHDLDAAHDLLTRALGRRRTRIELVCLTSNQFPVVAEVAAAVEAQLQRINVRLKVVALPVTELYGRLARGEFDVCVMMHRVGYGGLWPYMFWHSRQRPRYFLSGYDAADAALDALYTARTPDEERVAASAVVEVMRRDPPAAFLVANPNIDGVRRSARSSDGRADDGLLPHSILMEAMRCGAY